MMIATPAAAIRYRKPECRFPVGAFKINFSAHLLNDLLANAQPEAGAAVLASGRRSRLRERLEQWAAKRVRYAGPLAGH